MTELIETINNTYKERSSADFEDTVLGDYQEFVDTTALAYIPDYPLVYPALGLAGETGEVVERIKKLSRIGPSWSSEDKDYLALELGDILWYVTRIANILDLDLDDIMERNIQKLVERQKHELPTLEKFL